MLAFKAPVTTAEDDILLIYVSYISRDLLGAHVRGILRIISYVSIVFFLTLLHKNKYIQNIYNHTILFLQ